MRSGEAKRLEWTDIDFEKSIVTLNKPEKGSLARMWRVSLNLITMLNLLPKTSIRVFATDQYEVTKQHTQKCENDSRSNCKTQDLTESPSTHSDTGKLRNYTMKQKTPGTLSSSSAINA
jgi:integrase